MISQAFLGGGCFWCLEGIFKELEGVDKVVSGYMGGHIPNPSYEQVCLGNTGHAEVIKVNYHADVIDYQKLLRVFFSIHDPTTINRQGNDIGPQYRSVVFFESEEEKSLIQKVIHNLENKKLFANAIVTEIVPAATFYQAEGYHQDYLQNNSWQPYCQMVINPKLQKFREQWSALLRE